MQFRIIGWHQPDIGDIAETLRVVHSVSDHKMVGDLESHIIGFDLLQPPRRLVEQRGYTEAARLVLLEEATQKAECKTGVEDILDDNDVLALDRLIEVLDQLHCTAGPLPLTVARHRDEVEGAVHGDGARQVGEENRRALQHAHQHHALSGVVGVNLAAYLRSALGDLLFTEEDGEVFMNCAQAVLVTFCGC